jgi:hypothetical protein
VIEHLSEIAIQFEAISLQQKRAAIHDRGPLRFAVPLARRRERVRIARAARIGLELSA